jgi:NTE family protein
MIVAASTTLFAVVFGLFVVATAVLLVLTLRFVIRQSRRSRAEWLAATGDADDGTGGDDGEDREDGDDGTDESLTALVLAGGSTRGAIQIGMLQVLAEHGFVPDRVYGSSVGAINGAGFAADPTREGVERMTRIWLDLKREDIYRAGRLHGPWLYFQQREGVYANSGLRQIIEEGFPYERLEEAVVPVEVVATSLTDGGERWFTSGPATEAILASAAMPAIFPPVQIDGERYIDGGVVNNVPIQRAIDSGATRIVILLCSPPVVTPAPSRRPVESMVNALFIAIHARFVRDMAHLPEGVEVILCAGPEGATRDFDDFSTTAQLIALGRAEASEIVRRYGLGTIPYPAPPLPVPAATVVDDGTGGAVGSDPPLGPRPVPERAGPDDAAVATPPDPVTPTDGTVGPAGQSGSTVPSGPPVATGATAAADPVTQPDPGR